MEISNPSMGDLAWDQSSRLKEKVEKLTTAVEALMDVIEHMTKDQHPQYGYPPASSGFLYRQAVERARKAVKETKS